jgi:NAD(P)-dependent dehydrogenase (short-subunit alcohol dehydrogenase family)
MKQDLPVALVTGVGPGTGAAIARRFARGGYAVAMLARNRDRLDSLEREIEHSSGYACDVTDETALDTTIANLRADLGTPKILVHNAVGGAFGTFLEIEPQVLDRNFQLNTMALLYLAQRLAPAMVEAGEGAIIVTGNTSAIRGKPRFAGFAPTKAAQRILAESIAREIGPKGVHVAYVMIDAVIDLEWTRAMFSKPAGDPFFIQPPAIAEEVWHVAHQERCAWTFNVEVRPFAEPW